MPRPGFPMRGRFGFLDSSMFFQNLSSASLLWIRATASTAHPIGFEWIIMSGLYKINLFRYLHIINRQPLKQASIFPAAWKLFKFKQFPREFGFKSNNTKSFFRDNSAILISRIACYAPSSARGIDRKRPLYRFEVKINHYLKLR